jgi:hypothetical protein
MKKLKLALLARFVVIYSIVVLEAIQVGSRRTSGRWFFTIYISMRIVDL